MNFLLKAKKFSYMGKKKKKDCYQYRYQTRYASAEADDCFLVEMYRVFLKKVLHKREDKMQEKMKMT